MSSKAKVTLPLEKYERLVRQLEMMRCHVKDLELELEKRECQARNIANPSPPLKPEAEPK